MSEDFKELLDADEEVFGDSYEFKLKDFDGPLDALLHLIKKSKYSIEDVAISEITEQYLGFMKDIDEVDLNKVADFVSMAAWLLEIKSKSLLPKPVEIEEDEEDGEALLRKQLAEYKLYKEASQKMKELETVGIHYREPDDSVGKPRFVLKSMDPSGLIAALQKVFLRFEERSAITKERHIVKDRFTVEEKISQIKDSFIDAKRRSFFEMFDEKITKSEIITTFQALLELLKEQFVRAEQAENYGDIILYKVEKDELG